LGGVGGGGGGGGGGGVGWGGGVWVWGLGGFCFFFVGEDWGGVVVFVSLKTVCDPWTARNLKSNPFQNGFTRLRVGGKKPGTSALLLSVRIAERKPKVHGGVLQINISMVRLR